MGIVQLNKVEKNYKLGETIVRALKPTTLEIRKGEFTAVIGASGSGKSTLLNLMGCIDVPDSGQVFIDSIDVSTLTDDKKSDLRNQKIGFIFQSFNLIPVLNVFENVELPLLINPMIRTPERRQRIEEALKDVGLAEPGRAESAGGLKTKVESADS